MNDHSAFSGWPHHIAINDCGTVVGFTIISDEGKAWWAENVNDYDAGHIGGTVYADHRPAQDIVAAIEREWPLELKK